MQVQFTKMLLLWEKLDRAPLSNGSYVSPGKTVSLSLSNAYAVIDIMPAALALVSRQDCIPQSVSDLRGHAMCP